MKKTIKIATLMSLALLASSAVLSAEYSMAGKNSLAIKVCQSVVEDSPKQLQSALRQHRRNSVGIGATYSSKTVRFAKDFRCNDNKVGEFAVIVGAHNIVGYLETGDTTSYRVKMEELAAN